MHAPLQRRAALVAPFGRIAGNADGERRTCGRDTGAPVRTGACLWECGGLSSQDTHAQRDERAHPYRHARSRKLGRPPRRSTRPGPSRQLHDACSFLFAGATATTTEVALRLARPAVRPSFPINVCNNVDEENAAQDETVAYNHSARLRPSCTHAAFNDNSQRRPGVGCIAAHCAHSLAPRQGCCYR